MGSLLGHLVPGIMFLLISIWWFIGDVIEKCHGRYYRRGSPSLSVRVWYSCPGARLSKLPLEPMAKIFLAVIGVLGELLLSKSVALVGEDGELVADHLNNYGHSVMYCFFGLSGAVDLVKWYKLFPLPAKFDFAVFSTALWMEGLLFSFHLHGRSELDVRLHTLLYLLIFVTAALFLLEAISAKPVPFSAFFRAYLLSLQGTWFLQIGFVLYGPNRWKNSPTNVAFTAIAFAFHAFILLAVYLISHFVCYHVYIKKYRLNDGILEGNLDEDVSSVMLDDFSED